LGLTDDEILINKDKFIELGLINDEIWFFLFLKIYLYKLKELNYNI
jgi:hypothetical protein